ncbi:hypothetical protein K488DRAFT_76776 [Vararia minispora EC-137]|uniref:Uncharacterized protein n=1 Tax=Vararia minispora EC-137 TaxID=1314806 RepID=A0ACB8QTJ1_9AGAM|nr:hypothetical protein K488DRAFT_76776 [Vararia minispora EC-137]
MTTSTAGLFALSFLLSVSAVGCVAYFTVGRLRRRRLPDFPALTGVPLPNPLPDFDITKARPRPYRPFRWVYHQHMSLKKMEPDYWLELESTYHERIAQRLKLYETEGSNVLAMLPGTEHACRELLEMVVQFLCTRYPKQFIYDECSGVLTNNILGTQSNIYEDHPLETLIRHVPEDFAFTLPDPKTGFYHCVAGVICSSVGWNLGEKVGKPLSEIHDVVPHYKEKMEFSMDRYFQKMPLDKPIQRGSWALEIQEPLYLQTTHKAWERRANPDPILTLDEVCIRVDWQTLRRLPRSRAIVFNFKALFTPIRRVRSEPYIPRLLLRILQDGDNKLLTYKGRHTNHVVLPALTEWAREQEEKGWVPKGWQERTLDEDPFFPGWEEAMKMY